MKLLTMFSATLAVNSINLVSYTLAELLPIQYFNELTVISGALLVLYVSLNCKIASLLDPLSFSAHA